MRRNLALLVELEWAEGGLGSQESVTSFSQNVVFKLISSKIPKAQWGNLSLARTQIEGDIYKTLKVLRYGGRRPADLPQKRLEFLKTSKHLQFLTAIA